MPPSPTAGAFLFFAIQFRQRRRPTAEQCEEFYMRLLFGIILGVFLTVGFAYLYDASTGRPAESAAQTSLDQRPMVNWDVVSGKWNGWSLSVRNTWNKLAAR
jgi:hypothetical protein